MTMTEEEAKERFRKFIDEAMDHLFIEATIVKKLIRAFDEAGTPFVKVDDTEERVDVNGERAILEQVFNLDECWLITASGSWVRVVLGNEWDCLVDYTTDIEETIAPVNAWIERHMR